MNAIVRLGKVVCNAMTKPHVPCYNWIIFALSCEIIKSNDDLQNDYRNESEAGFFLEWPFFREEEKVGKEITKSKFSRNKSKIYLKIYCFFFFYPLKSWRFLTIKTFKIWWQWRKHDFKVKWIGCSKFNRMYMYSGNIRCAFYDMMWATIFKARHV